MTRSGRRHREGGVAAAEYVGVALLAGVVVAALVMVLTPSNVSTQARKAWCMITMGHCSADAGTIDIDIDAQLPKCEVTSQEYKGEVEGTAFSVNLGVNGKLRVAQVKMPDGSTKWTVQLVGGGKLGAHVMFGEKGEFGLGEGLSAEAKAALAAEGGATWQFDSQDQVAAFLQGMAKEAAKQGVANASGILGPVTKWGLDKIVGRYDPPAPSEYYVQAGTQGSAEITAAAGLKAKLSAEGTNALGVKVAPGANGESPTYTFYYKGTQKLASELGLVEGGLGANGSAQTETVVGISYKDGEPVSASIQAAGTLSSNLLATAKGNKVPIGKNTGTPKVGVSDGDTWQGKLTLTLDLTNGDNVDALADTLQSTGLPLLSDYGTPGYQDPVTAVQRLADRFATGGPEQGASITAQEFEGEKGRINVGLFAGDLLAFGAGGSVETSTQTATNAYYYDPGVGMVQWQRCVG